MVKMGSCIAVLRIVRVEALLGGKLLTGYWFDRTQEFAARLPPRLWELCIIQGARQGGRPGFPSSGERCQASR